MLKRLLTICSLFMIATLSHSCLHFGKTTAPKSIKNTQISFYQTKVGPDDEAILHHNLIYEFKEDGTYTSTFQGSNFEDGDYSYVLVNHKTARVILSYTWKADEPALTYIMEMTFDTPNKGSWRSTYIEDEVGSETGTFQILAK